MARKTMHLSEDSFIAKWGDIASQWGLSSNAGQIIGVLYLYQQPMPVEEIRRHLNAARATVTTALGELLNGGFVIREHPIGDRREHYSTLSNPWELFRCALQMRKREAERLSDVFKKIVNDAPTDKVTRFREMAEFCDVIHTWYSSMVTASPSELKGLLKYHP